jgi:hypothetical protein
MTWNYRIMRRKDWGGAYIYSIHEVYYNNEGIGYTEPLIDSYESVDELITTLELMLADAKKFKDDVVDYVE